MYKFISACFMAMMIFVLCGFASPDVCTAEANSSEVVGTKSPNSLEDTVKNFWGNWKHNAKVSWDSAKSFMVSKEQQVFLSFRDDLISKPGAVEIVERSAEKQDYVYYAFNALFSYSDEEYTASQYKQYIKNFFHPDNDLRDVFQKEEWQNFLSCALNALDIKLKSELRE